MVGAYGDDNNRGAVYVLTRQSGTWGEVAKLTASDKDAGDKFGSTVAVDGDTVVVGAHRNDEHGTDSGSAYVFTKPATVWVDATETADLKASDGAAYDQFGASVSVDGDTVVVGTGLNSDSAYVFTKPDTVWVDATETVKLTAFDGANFDWFGKSVAVDGDTVVVGAPRVRTQWLASRLGLPVHQACQRGLGHGDRDGQADRLRTGRSMTSLGDR